MLLIDCFVFIIPIWLLVYYYKALVFPQLEELFYKAANWILLTDCIIKFVSAIMFQLGIIDDLDTFEIIVCYFPALECLIIFLLYKIFKPVFDARKVVKPPRQRKFPVRRRIFFVLLCINPLVTIETHLFACGYFGIIDLLSRSDEQSAESVFMLVYTIAIYILVTVIFLVWFSKMRGKFDTQRGITLADIDSDRPPIVFLRSFELNKSAVSTCTLDEHLTQGFSLIQQPVISLADPDIAFSDGSIKVQANDETWTEAVKKMFQYCRAVIIFEGKSDGLNWEIENIRQYVSYKKFFIATPPEDYRIVAWVAGSYRLSSASKFRIKLAKKFNKKSISYAFNFVWNKFSSKMRANGIITTETEPGSGCLISFDKDWNQKNVYTNLSGNEFFSKILELTDEPTTSFDYNVLRGSIKEYEVTGKIAQEVVQKYKRMTAVIVGLQIVVIIFVNLILFFY